MSIVTTTEVHGMSHGAGHPDGPFSTTIPGRTGRATSHPLEAGAPPAGAIRRGSR